MEYVEGASGRRLAFARTAGAGPGVVFLGGFRSDMTGTKALFLEGWARDRGRAFLRFDYGGHGASSGDFDRMGIADWRDDALTALDALTEGPQVLVGSSMGGWIALLAARARPAQVAGLVLIAPAPDFTEDLIRPGLTAAEAAALAAGHPVDRPSAYAPEPYRYTAALMEQGRANLVLRAPLALPFPVRILHGAADADVPPAHALRLFDHATGSDIRVTLVKDADHRFSSSACLAMIAAAAEEVT